MELIRVYEDGSIEAGVLDYFAKVFNTEMEEKANGQYHMFMKDVYFDFSQDWKYTTLIVSNGFNHWQAFCPRDYKNIIASDSFSKVREWAIDYVKALLNGNKDINLTF